MNWLHRSSVIPTAIDQDRCAHWRSLRDMKRHGWSMNLFHASQQWSMLQALRTETPQASRTSSTSWRRRAGFIAFLTERPAASLSRVTDPQQSSLVECSHPQAGAIASSQMEEGPHTSYASYKTSPGWHPPYDRPRQPRSPHQPA